MGTTDDDLTRPVATVFNRSLVVVALAALRWAQLAAWLLLLHEDHPWPKLWLDRVELHTDLMPSVENVAGELVRVEALANEWRSEDDELSPRVAAIDAVRRAILAALDALEGKELARDEGVRETIALTLRAHRLYAGDTSPGMKGMLDGAARVLAPLTVQATAPRAKR